MIDRSDFHYLVISKIDPFILILRIRNAEYRELLDHTNDDYYDGKYVPMQRQRRIRQENVLEAQIQPGDTLQAIALRYNCTVSILSSVACKALQT